MWHVDRGARPPVVTGIHGLACWKDSSGGLHISVDWRGAEKLRAAGILVRHGSGAVSIELGADEFPRVPEPRGSADEGARPQGEVFRWLRIEGRGPGEPSGGILVTAEGGVACVAVSLECAFQFFEFCERGYRSGSAVLGECQSTIHVKGPASLPRPAAGCGIADDPTEVE